MTRDLIFENLVKIPVGTPVTLGFWMYLLEIKTDIKFSQRGSKATELYDQIKTGFSHNN